jgi:RNA polymerase sigma-70 factor (ECF subfamily)
MTRAEVERAFTAHKDAVYRFAWRMAPEAADDIAQEVFLRLLRGQVHFDEARGSLRSFLLGVARNLALQHLRSNARWEPIDEEQFVASPLFAVRLKADTASDSFEIGEIVGRAVRALPPLQRDVFILAEYEELSLDEIARAVDTNVGAVKARLHRARENLRRMLAPLRDTANRVG